LIEIESSNDAIAITKNGASEAVLLSMNKFEGLEETLKILSDEKAMRSIRKSIYVKSKFHHFPLDRGIVGCPLTALNRA